MTKLYQIVEQKEAEYKPSFDDLYAEKGIIFRVTDVTLEEANQWREFEKDCKESEDEPPPTKEERAQMDRGLMRAVFKSSPELVEELMQHRILTPAEIISYEINASWWAGYIGWSWLQKFVGLYFAQKVNRKFTRYQSNKILDKICDDPILKKPLVKS